MLKYKTDFTVQKSLYLWSTFFPLDLNWSLRSMTAVQWVWCHIYIKNIKSTSYFVFTSPDAQSTYSYWHLRYLLQVAEILHRYLYLGTISDFSIHMKYSVNFFKKLFFFSPISFSFLLTSPNTYSFICHFAHPCMLIFFCLHNDRLTFMCTTYLAILTLLICVSFYFLVYLFPVFVFFLY